MSGTSEIGDRKTGRWTEERREEDEGRKRRRRQGKRSLLHPTATFLFRNTSYLNDNDQFRGKVTR